MAAFSFPDPGTPYVVTPWTDPNGGRWLYTAIKDRWEPLPEAGTYADLSDAATVNLPAVNGPLYDALASKFDSSDLATVDLPAINGPLASALDAKVDISDLSGYGALAGDNEWGGTNSFVIASFLGQVEFASTTTFSFSPEAKGEMLTSLGLTTAAKKDAANIFTTSNTFNGETTYGSTASFTYADDTVRGLHRSSMGLGTLATQSGTFSGTHSGNSSGNNTGDQTITLTGDVTGTGAGSFTTTLATVATAGSYGTSNTSPSITIDAKGRVLAIELNAIGLANQATALATTRTIGGSNFNGTANVTSFPVPGDIGNTTPATSLAVSGTSVLANTSVTDFAASSSTVKTITRSTALTTGSIATLEIIADTSGTIADNLGATLGFNVAGSGSPSSRIADIISVRQGANNSGDLILGGRAAGTFVQGLLISRNGGHMLTGSLAASLGVSTGPAVLVSALPSASVNPWLRRSVSDATASHTTGVGAAVTGGGANLVPVYSNGTNWRIG